ncbi:hypothetical protein OIU78_020460 [Salix suchowensis]|nr:hypothetical protein OIU78_020460 [Salix suchowensis]
MEEIASFWHNPKQTHFSLEVSDDIIAYKNNFSRCKFPSCVYLSRVQAMQKIFLGWVWQPPRHPLRKHRFKWPGAVVPAAETATVQAPPGVLSTSAATTAGKSQFLQ